MERDRCTAYNRPKREHDPFEYASLDERKAAVIFPGIYCALAIFELEKQSEGGLRNHGSLNASGKIDMPLEKAVLSVKRVIHHHYILNHSQTSWRPSQTQISKAPCLS